MGAIKDLYYMENEISLSLYCRAISHPARVKILNQLYDEPVGCRNIDLTKCLMMSRATVKNHVDMMKDAGIINIKYFTHYYQISLNQKGIRFAEMIRPVAN
ncbi:MAG: winged helix-turn-helix domain-containing protein [Bacteroidota bacterium]